MADSFDRQIRDAERERRSQERKKTWEKREKKFWRTFLFTEEGKPKSGFGLYTFCLSFVFLAVDAVIFGLVIDWMTPHMETWPPLISNIVQSLTASVLTLAVPLLIHRLCKDKRLVFGTYLWLTLYAVVVVIAMALILRDGEAIGAFGVFYAWFVVIPLALGLLISWLLFRRDWRPPVSGEELPAWTRYTRRR